HLHRLHRSLRPAARPAAHGRGHRHHHSRSARSPRRASRYGLALRGLSNGGHRSLGLRRCVHLRGHRGNTAKMDHAADAALCERHGRLGDPGARNHTVGLHRFGGRRIRQITPDYRDGRALTMDVNMKMPDLATNEGVELGIVRWLVDIGASVKRGEPLLEVETDKALQEVESIVTGVLRYIHAPAGAKVAVGTVIATIRVG